MLLLRRKTLAVVEKNLALPLWNPFTKRRKRSSGWSPIAIHRVKEKRTSQSWEYTSKLTGLFTRNRYCPRYVLYSSYPKCYEMLELTYRFTNSTSLLKMPFVQITWKILQNWSIFSSHRLRWGRLCLMPDTRRPILTSTPASLNEMRFGCFYISIFQLFISNDKLFNRRSSVKFFENSSQSKKTICIILQNYIKKRRLNVIRDNVIFLMCVCV